MTPDTLTFIQTVGFPIALVIYLLARFEPRQERSERVASENTQKVERSLASVSRALREVRRAQLLYVQAHPAMSKDVKDIAGRMLAEAERDEIIEQETHPVPPVPAP